MSLIVRLLSSRDPVDLKRVTLSVYAGPVMFTLLEVIILELPPWMSENPQVTTRNGDSGGVTVVVNITVPPTAAVRLSGSTPAPWLTTGGDRYSRFGINAISNLRLEMTMQSGSLGECNQFKNHLKY